MRWWGGGGVADFAGLFCCNEGDVVREAKVYGGIDAKRERFESCFVVVAEKTEMFLLRKPTL
jgi:hypothetical protein